MSSSGVQSLAVRNLELLRAIEDMVDGLVADTDLVTSISRTYFELKSKLLPNTTEVDPSGRICAVLDKASNSCVRIYNDAKNRHVSARLDPQVLPDDGLVEAYTSLCLPIVLTPMRVSPLRLERFRRCTAGVWD